MYAFQSVRSTALPGSTSAHAHRLDLRLVSFVGSGDHAAPSHLPRAPVSDGVNRDGRRQPEWSIDLRHSMLDWPAGTWWMLLEADTGFSSSRVHHPWIFHVAYSARLAFAHGCPR